MRVLLVENDSSKANILAGFFAAQQLRTEIADTGEDALALLRHYPFDLVVVSLILPDMEGTRAISRMRRSAVSTPVLALSPRHQPRSSVDAFTAGADDVVEETADRNELLARMHAIVRRSRGHSQSTIGVGPLTLHVERHEIRANGIPLQLTGKEFEILKLLMLRKNMVLSKDAILEQIYGGLDEPEVKIIDVFICKIRKKLAIAGLKNSISTVWGRGYAIQDSRLRHEMTDSPCVPEPVIPSESPYALA